MHHGWFEFLAGHLRILRAVETRCAGEQRIEPGQILPAAGCPE